jgi:4'-phosphopantetheinyl transferase
VIGVDVEATSEMVDTPGFIDRVATAREVRVIADRAPGERRDALARLWTRKEACLKATGDGIGAGVAHVDVPLDRGLWQAPFQPFARGGAWLLYDLTPPVDGFAAALVVAPGWTTLPEIVVTRR